MNSFSSKYISPFAYKFFVFYNHHKARGGKMKRNFAWILLMALVMGGWLLAEEGMMVKVKVPSANVRSKPDAAAPVIAKVAAGTVLKAYGKEGVWYEVGVFDPSGKETSGYIHETVVEASTEKATLVAAARQEVIRARSELKSYAGGGFKLLGGLSLGNGKFYETLPANFTKKNRMSFMGGLGYESGGMLAFSIEALYSPGGAVIHAENPSDPTEWVDITIAANAITLPVTIKVRFLRGAMTPFIFAGGEIGYILDAKVKSAVSTGETDEEDMLAGGDINRLIYGVVFGGGFEFQVGGMNLLLEGRYRLGLSNLIKDPDPGEYMKPTALTFLLGIKF
jgi:hypothetical protein